MHWKSFLWFSIKPIKFSIQPFKYSIQPFKFSRLVLKTKRQIMLIKLRKLSLVFKTTCLNLKTKTKIHMAHGIIWQNIEIKTKLKWFCVYPIKYLFKRIPSPTPPPTQLTHRPSPWTCFILYLELDKLPPYGRLFF